jgi:hypothetical protein
MRRCEPKDYESYAPRHHRPSASFGMDWPGRLAECVFLFQPYDLSQLPSTDYRLELALEDIRQRRGNFGDWDADWVFHE